MISIERITGGLRWLARWIIIAPVVAIVLFFSVANRHLVTITIDPFDNDVSGLSLTMPLFLALFITFMLGLVMGGVMVFLSQGRWRRQARTAAREVASLRAEKAAATHAPGASPVGGLLPLLSGRGDSSTSASSATGSGLGQGLGQGLAPATGPMAAILAGKS